MLIASLLHATAACGQSRTTRTVFNARRGPLSALALLVLAACGPDVSRTTRFVEVAAPDDATSLVVRAKSASEARAELIAALDSLPGAPRTLGQGAWRTVAVVRGDESPADALRAGHVYARHEGDVRLEVSVSQGPLRAEAAGLLITAADRVLLELHVAAPGVRAAQFRLALHADARPGGIAPVDVTPAYLRRPLPAGRYRALLDVPAGGARWVASVTVLDGRGDEAARAWASAVGVARR